MADNLEVGDKLHAKYIDGEFYLAEVVAISQGKKRAKAPVKVSFLGYGTEDETWLAVSDLKSKKLPKAAEPKAKAKAKAKAEPVKKIDVTTLEKGLRLQAQADDGKWYLGEVVAVSKKRNTVKVNYVGYTSASDEWVGPDRVRSKALTEAAPKAKAKAKAKAKSKKPKSERIDKKKLNVCICGAGNAAHVFSSLFPAAGITTTVFADFQDEAERFKAATDANGGVEVVNRSDPENVVKTRGKPSVITKNAEEVVPQADVIIAALPSFAMKNVFTGIKPHLKEGVIIFTMPGSGGCEFVAREIIGEELRSGKCTLAGLLPMPLNARITTWGEQVDLAAIKVAYDLSALPMENAPKAAKVFQALLGKKTRSVGSFMGMALNGGNPNNHPPRLMAAWKDHVEGKTYPENPLFYETWDDEAEEWCAKISNERLNVWNAIVEKFPEVGPKDHLMDVRKYMAVAYKGQISDDSTIKNVFAKNAGLTGFHFPMVKKEGSDPEEWEINFTNRYFTEDIPDGLCVYKGYAELAGVETPGIDAILNHFQKFMGKEYIKDGKLAGADAMSTKAPQAFGYTTLESLLKA